MSSETDNFLWKRIMVAALDSGQDWSKLQACLDKLDEINRIKAEELERLNRFLNDTIEACSLLSYEYENLKEKLRRILEEQKTLTYEKEKVEILIELKNLEMRIQNLIHEKEKLKLEYQEIEGQLINQVIPLDHNVLKSEIYRQLGFDLIIGKDGKYEKMRIRSDIKDEITSISLEEYNQELNYEQEVDLANYLWNSF